MSLTAVEIKPMSLIKLSDEQTILEQHKKKRYVDYVEHIVVKVTSFEEQNQNLRIHVAQIDTPNLYVITVEAKDGEHYSVVSFVPDAFKVGEIFGGNRQDLLENDMSWIFTEPKDVNDFMLNELEFTKSLFNEEVEYVPLHDTLYGASSEESMFAFAHLRATTETKNSEIFILEHGNLEDEAGGHIMMYQGAVLNDGELEIIR